MTCLSGLLVVGLLGAEVPPPAPQTQTRSLEEAIDLLADTPEQARRLRREQAQVLYLQAEEALRMGKPARALELARTAARLDPELEAAAALADRLRDHEDTDQVRADRSAGPVALHAALVRGHRAFQAGRMDEAGAWFRAVVRGANRLARGPQADAYVDHAALALAVIARRARGRSQATLPNLPVPPLAEVGPPGAAGADADPAQAPAEAGSGPSLPEGDIEFPGWFVRLKRQLAQRVSHEFAEAPIQDVVTYLRQATGANIVLDRQGLEAMGYRLKPVDLKADDLQAETVLWLAATLANCAVVYRNEVALVTSPDQAKRLGRSPDLPPADLHFDTPRAAAEPLVDPARLAAVRQQVDGMGDPEAFVRLCGRLGQAGARP